MTKRVQIAADNVTVSNVSVLGPNSPAGTGVFMDVADSVAVAPYWTWNGNLTSPVFTYGAGPAVYPPYAPALGTTTTLFIIPSADMTSIADQQLIQSFPFSQYVIDRIVIGQATGPVTEATGGIYTTPSKGGQSVVPAVQNYAGLKASTDVMNPSLSAPGTTIMNTGLYLHLDTPNTLPSSVSIFVMGIAA